jgi:hypothetical protein
MRKSTQIAILSFMVCLGGCAGMGRQLPLPGAPAEQVRAGWGAPTALYPAPSGQVWEYATGPMGQSTWMVRVGADGRVVSAEQVLTGEKFAAIQVDRAGKDEVLRSLGQPAEVSRVAMHNYEVWSYRYKEAGVWNSMMHVHFDQAGVVRMMQNGPDPMYEEKRRFFD